MTVRASSRKESTGKRSAQNDQLEGQHTTYEGSLLIISGHMHEHLGQLIAYARINGIVPPWS